MVNHVVRWMDAALNLLVLLLVAVVLFVSVYSLMDNIQLYRNAQDDSLFVYKPPLGTALADYKRISEKQTAWLTLHDTSVDYPVMQGKNNFEFLNLDPYGEFRMSGSIFLDCTNNKDYKDEYSLIYGHHMDHTTMFGALDLYLDKDYFDSHAQGTLTTADGVYDIDLFAVSGADGTDPTIFSPHGRTTEEIIAYIEENADIYTGYEAGKPILALSTCYGETAESRLVVFGTLTRR